jgi:hypothetical protein
MAALSGFSALLRTLWRGAILLHVPVSFALRVRIQLGA